MISMGYGTLRAPERAASAPDYRASFLTFFRVGLRSREMAPVTAAYADSRNVKRPPCNQRVQGRLKIPLPIAFAIRPLRHDARSII